MTAETASQRGRMRLFYHLASSASMRVTLYLRCRGIPASQVELVSTGFEAEKFEVYANMAAPEQPPGQIIDPQVQLDVPRG